MLKRLPADRISAVDALNHDYFSESMDDEEVDVVPEMMKSIVPESPMMMNGNTMRQKVKKDSCLEFKMGR